MNKQQSGFTLIELMIVVAIIGILASIAMPAYQNYTKRSHVSEGLSLSASLKMGMTEYYASRGVFPTKKTELGYETDTVKFGGNAVKDVTIGNADGTTGELKIEFNEKVENGKFLVLKADTSQGSIIWKCDAASDIDTQYLSADCRDQVNTTP